MPLPSPLVARRPADWFWHAAPAGPPSPARRLTDWFWHYPGAQGMVITMGCVLVLLVAVQAAYYIRHRVRRQGEMVPAAPGDHEHFSYFKHQWRRSLTVVYAILSAGGLYGLYAVFTKSWVWYPFLVTLAVMVPWTLYMIIVTLRRPTINIDTHKMMVADLRRPSVDVFIPPAGKAPPWSVTPMSMCVPSPGGGISACTPWMIPLTTGSAASRENTGSRTCGDPTGRGERNPVA